MAVDFAQWWRDRYPNGLTGGLPGLADEYRKAWEKQKAREEHQRLEAEKRQSKPINLTPIK